MDFRFGREVSRISGFSVFLVLLLLSASSFAACIPSKREMYVPAIMDENRSGMVSISVETRPGSGEVYVSVYPTVGIYTQLSERVAAEVAFGMTRQRDCDVFLKIDVAEQINRVDGPSAGAAMTLLMLSTLEQKPLRDDFSITGTIERDGSIGKVGGVPLKAEAVSKLGKRLFLVPKLSQGDKVALITVNRFYNLTIAEVDSVSEAYQIALSNETPNRRLALEAEKVREYPTAVISNPASTYFTAVADRMVSDAERRISAVDGEVRENFASRLRSAQSALSTGNDYTAANTAFLLLIDTEFVNYSMPNMIRTRDEVDSCLANFTVGNKSLDNYEMLAAAELRYLRASDRKPDMDLSALDNEFVFPKLSTYYDMLFAKYWCRAATDFGSYVPAGNQTFFDESIAEEQAQQLLLEVATAMEKAEDIDGDLEWHLDIAQQAFNRSMYIASIIDASFVLSGIDAANMTAEELENVSAAFTAMNASHLWPQLYAAHARTFEDVNRRTAMRLYLFASRLEEEFDRIDTAVADRIAAEALIAEIEAARRAAEAEAAKRAAQQEESVLGSIARAFRSLAGGLARVDQHVIFIVVLAAIALVAYMSYLELVRERVRARRRGKKKSGQRGRAGRGE